MGMKHVSDEELSDYMLWVRMQIFDDVQRMSKDTGTLVCMASINDFKGVSLFAAREPKFFACVTAVSKLGEGLAPLLGRKHVMVNTGPTFQVLMAAVSLIMPQRVL